MAYQISDGGSTPHATNYSDLLDKLIAFAVGTGGWQIVSDQLSVNGEIYLKGLDYSGDKDIYICIRRYANGGADIYGWGLQGYTGFTNSGFWNNPGAINGQIPVLPLWNDTLPYWFFVNPRRIIVVAKISSIYVSMYMGLCLPYSSAGQWSYPMVIGGSNRAYDNFANMSRYSDNSGNMTVPFMPLGDQNQSNLVVRVPTGQWVRIYNSYSSIVPPGSNQTVYTLHGVSPYADFRLQGGGANQGYRYIRPNLDGNYPLKPLRLLNGFTPDALGILDGVKFIPGYNLSSEDTVTEGSDEYVTFQDTFRTDLYNFYAVKKV